jgi:hypothetical protein
MKWPLLSRGIDLAKDERLELLERFEPFDDARL